jgi:hypothetical protein
MQTIHNEKLMSRGELQMGPKTNRKFRRVGRSHALTYPEVIVLFVELSFALSNCCVGGVCGIFAITLIRLLLINDEVNKNSGCGTDVFVHFRMKMEEFLSM